MKTNTKSVKVLTVIGLAVVSFISPCFEAVNANPNTSRRVGGQRGADVSGNYSVNTNDQVVSSV